MIANYKTVLLQTTGGATMKGNCQIYKYLNKEVKIKSERNKHEYAYKCRKCKCISNFIRSDEQLEEYSCAYYEEKTTHDQLRLF